MSWLRKDTNPTCRQSWGLGPSAKTLEPKKLRAMGRCLLLRDQSQERPTTKLSRLLKSSPLKQPLPFPLSQQWRRKYNVGNYKEMSFIKVATTQGWIWSPLSKNKSLQLAMVIYMCQWNAHTHYYVGCDEKTYFTMYTSTYVHRYLYIPWILWWSSPGSKF